MVREMIASLCILPFFFIIVLMLLVAGEYGPFNVYYWLFFSVIFLIIAAEIYSPKIKERYGLRTFALFCCWFGVSSFMMCGVSNRLLGCFSLICIAVGYDVGKCFFGRVLQISDQNSETDQSNMYNWLFAGVLLSNFVFFLLKKFAHQDQSIVTYPAFLFYPDDNFLKIQLLIFAAVIGDLIKPWFMRRIGVKSFGWIIPGHPGLVDRLNSLIFVSAMWMLVDTVWLGK